MSQAGFLAMRWLSSEFLAQRGLSAPDGRPLYAYRCTDAELVSLSDRLTAARIDHSRVESHLAALFCLFAAEWWRRFYDGNPWAWEPAFLKLGARYEWQTAKELTTKGLGFWKRELRRSDQGREFLLSLVLEGGLPLGLLAAGRGKITDRSLRLTTCQARCARVQENYTLTKAGLRTPFKLASAIIPCILGG